MRYAWLEEMVEDGLIRKEAAAAIYSDCCSVMEKSAEEPAVRKDLLQALLYGTAVTTMGQGAQIAAYQMRQKILDSQTKAKIDINRQRLVTMFSPKDREKAEARFNEIAKLAPHLATNEMVMRKLLQRKVRNGLSERDTRALLMAQMDLDPRAKQYGATKRASQEFMESRDLKATLAGNAMADACLAAHNKLSDDLFCKTAGHIMRSLDAAVAMELEKTAKVPGGFTDQLKYILNRAAASAAIAGGLTGGYALSRHMKDRNMAVKLDNSFNKAIQMSPDSPLTENKDKARQAFGTLAHFAPHVAAEPHAAKAYMMKMVEYDRGPQVGDIKDLAEIEKNLGSIRGGMLDMLSHSMQTANTSLAKNIEGAWGEVTDIGQSK